MTATREKQIADLVGNLASIAVTTIVCRATGFGWEFFTTAILAGLVNVAGYVEGQASVRRYLDGER